MRDRKEMSVSVKAIILRNSQRLIQSFLLHLALIGVSSVTGLTQEHAVSYGIDEGLGRDDVTCIFQDKNGILWVGTNGAGLYQFNLGRFKQEELTPDLTGYYLSSIERRGDNVVIASEKGVFEFNGSALRTLVSGIIQNLLVTDTHVWLTKEDSICLYNGISLRCIGTGADILQIISDAANAGVVIPGVGAYRQDLSMSLEMTGFGRARYLGQDGQKGRWFQDESGYFTQYQGEIPVKYPVKLTRVNAFETGSVGNLLLGTDEGVYVLQTVDSILISLNVDAQVSDLYFDSYDRLWIGTKHHGLLRYFGQRYRLWKFEGDKIPGILAGSTIAKSYLHSQGFVHGLTTQLITEVSADAQVFIDPVRDKLWTLANDGLWLQQDTTWIRLDSTITSNGEGQILGSDLLGLWIMIDGKLYHYRIQPTSFPIGVRYALVELKGEIPGDRLVAMLTDQSGKTWRVGERSVGDIESETYSLTHDIDFEILSAAIDTTGRIWLGTSAAGIYYVSLKSENPNLLRSGYPIRNQDVISIVPIGKDLVVCTDRSILRLGLNLDMTEVVKVFELDKQTGLSFRELTPADIACTSDHFLLVRSSSGVYGFDLGDRGTTAHVPQPFLSDVKINGIDIRQTRYNTSIDSWLRQVNPIYLRPGDNQVTFMCGVSLVEDEPVFYMYRSGQDSAWSEPSLSGEVSFTDLDPGAYVFEFRACDAAGNCSVLNDPWLVIVERSVWSSWWFRMLCVGIFSVLLVQLIKYIRRRRRHAAALDKRRLEAELNALVQEQKALQLQMNPHFIFNALQALRGQIREDKLDSARANLTRFARLMRTTLDTSRKALISLEEELEFLRAYVDVEQLGSEMTIVYKVLLDEGLDAFEIDIPPMLIQPVLENAIKYGGDGNVIEVILTISLREDLLIVSVQDNGPGWGTAQSAHSSASLDIIRSRLARMGPKGNLDIKSTKEQGTTVTINIPIH